MLVGLFADRNDHSGANCAATFADRKTEFFFHCDWLDQFDVDCYVVAWHDHLSTFRQRAHTGDVCRTEVELRAIVGEERRMTATFIFGQDIGLSFEILVRLDRTSVAQDLATLYVFTTDTTDQRADIVTSSALVEQLAEHFNPSNRCFLRVFDADDFNFFANLDDPTLDTTRYNRATAGDGKHIFDWHQERHDRLGDQEWE